MAGASPTTTKGETSLDSWKALKILPAFFGQALSVSGRQRWFKFLTDGASVQTPRRVCPSLTPTARLKGDPRVIVPCARLSRRPNVECLCHRRYSASIW